MQPLSLPSLQPLAHPSGQPTSHPSSIPTQNPTNQPSLKPTPMPSMLPTMKPSVITSTEPSTQPRSQPAASTKPSMLTPTAGPSTLSPSARPTSPSAHPTPIPSCIPSVTPTAPQPAPNITSIFIKLKKGDEQRTLIVNVTVSVLEFEGLQVNNEAVVHCGAFAPYQRPSHISDVTTQQFSQRTTHQAAVITISSLQPASTYLIYCLTETYQGVRMSPSQFLSSPVTAITACCKKASYILNTRSISAGYGKLDAVGFTLSAAPDKTALNATFQLIHKYTQTALSTSQVSIFPSLLRFFPRSAPLTQRLSIFLDSTVLGGVYTISVSITTQALQEYTLIHPIGGSEIEVVGAFDPPTVPRLQSAIFSDDGTFIRVSFDSPTNKGGLQNSFICSKILSFIEVSGATCYWESTSVISISLAVNSDQQYGNASSHMILQVGSIISSINNQAVRAQCTGPAAQPQSNCKTWANSIAANVTVKRPASPTPPSVIIRTSATVSGCNNIVLDFTSSYGTGGRPWKSAMVTVTGSINSRSGTAVIDTVALNAFISSNFQGPSVPLVVPRSFLTEGTSYAFRAQLCTFLDVCSEARATVFVSVGNAFIPSVTILGLTKISIPRTTELTVTSKAFTVNCNGTKSSLNLKYKWSVYENDKLLTERESMVAISQSQDPSKFKLLPFTLRTLVLYRFVVEVYHIESLLSSVATTYVNVVQSPLVAQIAGGSARAIKLGDMVVLDASRSRDPDETSVSGSSRLFFEWKCVQIKPTLRLECPLSHTGPENGQQFTLFAAPSSTNSTSAITVLVSDGNSRMSEASIELTVQDASAPLVLITTSSELVTLVNKNDNLVITGTVETQSSCFAVWTVDNPTLDLKGSALTPLTTELLVSSAMRTVRQTVNLVVRGGSEALPERAALKFTLSCGLESAATIMVTTNGPPLPGSFNIQPSTGTELTTVFRLSAIQWSDANLPLSYQFGFVSGTTKTGLVVLARSELTYTLSTLPAGVDGSQVECQLQAYDSLNAVTRVSSSVTVTKLVDQGTLESILTSQLERAAGNVDETKQTISLATAALNSANCTGAPACSTLNRQQCLKTSNQCGACLPGFVGDSGDGDSLCRNASAYNTPDMWQVCDAVTGQCEIPLKSCPGGGQCSQRGTCVFVNNNNLQQIQFCRINDATCVAQCRCNVGYSGDSCAVTTESLQISIDLRVRMLRELLAVTRTDDINTG